jgi:replicative DNA helicase
MTSYEQSICGAICIDPDGVIPTVADIVTVDDFSDKRCAALFEAATEAVSRGKAIDAVLLADYISNTVDDPASFIRECMELSPTLANVGLHARRLHEEGRARCLRRELDKLTMLSGMEGDDLAASVVGVCQDFLKTGHSKRTVSLGEALAEVYHSLDEPQTDRIDTGYPRLDSILKGLHGGNLVLIGARPGVGKSAFSGDLAIKVAGEGKPVLLFSMEMMADEVAERVLARNAAIPLNTLIDRRINPDQYKLLSRTIGRIENLPLHICDDPHVTAGKIRAVSRSIPSLSLIIVDFISLMQSENRHDSRNLELGAISRDLKNLAAEMKIPIIALAQLNRGADETERPTLRSIRDSGELEQNANKVLFLWKVRPDQNIVGVSVAKNRRGGTGEVHFYFDGNYMRYSELPENVEEEKQPPYKRPRITTDDD